jgi:hypothetical protein
MECPFNHYAPRKNVARLSVGGGARKRDCRNRRRLTTFRTRHFFGNRWIPCRDGSRQFSGRRATEENVYQTKIWRGDTTGR